MSILSSDRTIKCRTVLKYSIMLPFLFIHPEHGMSAVVRLLSNHVIYAILLCVEIMKQ